MGLPEGDRGVLIGLQTLKWSEGPLGYLARVTRYYGSLWGKRGNSLNSLGLHRTHWVHWVLWRSRLVHHVPRVPKDPSTVITTMDRDF